MNLHLDWCSHEAAKYAVENWHYSKCMPTGRVIKIGVWENEEFMGVVLFGQGANRNMSGEFTLSPIEAAELVRVALRERQSPTSKICL